MVKLGLYKRSVTFAANQNIKKLCTAVKTLKYFTFCVGPRLCFMASLCSLFAFATDGSLPIDNNLAEHSIRRYTIMRNSTIHFGSKESVETAAAHTSVIGSVAMRGKSVFAFFGEIFKKCANGVLTSGSSYSKILGLP